MSKPLPEYHDRDGVSRPDNCERFKHGLNTGQLQLAGLSRAQYPGKKLLPRVLPGLRTVGYYNADHPQHWGTDWHCNEGLELSFLDSGQVTFGLEDREYPLVPGHATVTRPWLRHRLGNPNVGPSRFYWLVLDVGVRKPQQAWKWPSWIVLAPHDRLEMSQLFEQFPYHVWFADSTMRRCFHRLGKAIGTDRDGSNASLLAVLINELLVLLLEEMRIRHQRPIDVSVTSLQVVQLFWEKICRCPELLAQPWSLPDMAKYNGLGVSQFASLTRQLTSLSPRHHLQHCRLERAAAMLRDHPQLNVTEVAMACGYSSSQHFSRDFHQHFGCPPKIYRFSQPSVADNP